MFSLTILKLNACSRLENINDVVTCTYTRGRDCLHFTSTWANLWIFSAVHVARSGFRPSGTPTIFLYVINCLDMSLLHVTFGYRNQNNKDC